MCPLDLQLLLKRKLYLIGIKFKIDGEIIIEVELYFDDLDPDYYYKIDIIAL